jgi:hypothetical protein
MPVDLAELADDAAETLGPVAARREVTIDIEATGNTGSPALPANWGERSATSSTMLSATRHAKPGYWCR